MISSTGLNIDIAVQACSVRPNV